MKIACLALVTLPAAAAAQIVSPPILGSPQPVVVRPGMIAPLARPNMVAAAPCLSGAIIGEKGSDAIIGEEGRVIGERWSGTGFTTFKHVLTGRPGKQSLSLYGCSSASGGETVAVYLAGANGERKTGWRHFVIATRNGNTREGQIILPKPTAGEALSRLPIVIVVENASGKPNAGELRLKLTD